MLENDIPDWSRREINIEIGKLDQHGISALGVIIIWEQLCHVHDGFSTDLLAKISGQPIPRLNRSTPDQGNGNT
jgi:hypothetical protein